MSWDFYKNKQVKARREYPCDYKDHMELCDVFAYDKEKKIWSVDESVCKDFGISDEDIQTLKDYLEGGCIIKKGELHNVTSGKIEGMFAGFRCKISISDIVHKYELVEED